MTKKLIIIAQMRSGSTFLANALLSHSAIAGTEYEPYFFFDDIRLSYGEEFKKKLEEKRKEKEKDKAHSDFLSVEYPNYDPTPETIYELRKCTYCQVGEDRLKMIQEIADKIIHLYRPDVKRCAFSRHVNERIQYNKITDHVGHSKVRVSPPDTIMPKDRMRAWQRWCKAEISRFKNELRYVPHLELTYPELFNEDPTKPEGLYEADGIYGAVAEKICNYLEIPVCDMPSAYKRVNKCEIKVEQ